MVELKEACTDTMPVLHIDEDPIRGLRRCETVHALVLVHFVIIARQLHLRKVGADAIKQCCVHLADPQVLQEHHHRKVSSVPWS